MRTSNWTVGPADRLDDEVGWLRRCAGWIAQLDAGGYPSAVNLRPGADWPDTAHVTVDRCRVHVIIECIAADVDEFARARRPTRTGVGDHFDDRHP